MSCAFEFDNFCHNLRYLRTHHGLTQKQMAVRLHISVDYVRRLEKGDVPPRLGCIVFFYMSQCFAIPINHFLTTRLDEK